MGFSIQSSFLLDIAPALITAVFVIWLTWSIWAALRPRNNHSLRSVAILVLGDIGRSPRMMYHAQSFAENGFVTDLIGYEGSRPIPALERLPKVQLRYLPKPLKLTKWLPFVFAAPIKVIHELVSILLVLLVWIEAPPEFILVQNPPSIPTLVVAQLVARIRGSKVIIDWHNLGYSILALKLGPDHTFVRIYKWFERTFGRFAYAHLFVTRAMRDTLVSEWDLQGRKVVLYDRPPRHFHRSSAQEVHELFRKLQPVLASHESLHDFLPKSSPPYSTSFTHTINSPGSSDDGRILSSSSAPIATTASTYAEIRIPTLRPDRPALLVSSTSWTPDEDFSILIHALSMYEVRANETVSQEGGKLPKLLVILTGKGPLKETYMAKVGKIQKTWRWVRCISLWLEAEDYPILLGSANLGVCLHSSSSGLDLPMKVVDMFGCGLPVCALKFECLSELVKDGKNGLVFENASQLAEQLESLFGSFPNSTRLATLTSSLSRSSNRAAAPSHNPHIPKQTLSDDPADQWTWCTWDENWGRVIRPLILSDVNL